jgi:pSer/pThr/pTyr-binding forkhead associated (FHA) protein
MDGARSALLIASDDYTDPGLRRLRASASGVRALAAVLQDPGVGDFDVRTLLNEPAHRVGSAVEEFFADRQPDDLLLVHFFCHWVKDEDGELYFTMANTALSRLRSTAVAAEFVNRCMSRSRSRRVVLVLDGSYAAVFDRRVMTQPEEGMRIEQRFSGQGRAVIVASSAMEYALEEGQLADTSELSPSVLTSALVEGLQTGEADRDQDGLIALDELYDYIYDKTRAAAPNQTPGMWVFGVQGELVIARRPTTTPAPLSAELQSPRLPPTAEVLDEDVQFTVYRPVRLAATQWESLLVFTHKGGPVIDPIRGLLNPLEEVEARARAYFRDTETSSSRVDAQSALARGGQLSIVPELPHITCVPPAAHIVWWEPVHETRFQLHAGPELGGSVVRGWVRIWCGPLIVAELPIALPVVSADTVPASTPTPLTGQQLRRYRKIFPSYSHRDTQVVEPFAVAARAIGDQYLQDVLALDPGVRWRDELLKLIEDADVFQLFWSNNSMRSVQCRREWEYALALGRPQFIRPLYWEVPFPRAPDLGMPPNALSELHFARIPAAPPQHLDTPHLIVLAPDSYRGRRIPLDEDYVVVGREPTCGVRFDDPHVSRTHAVLRRRGNAIYVQDLGSSGGTFVNGTPATGALELHIGDVVAFATVTARLETGGTGAGEKSTMPNNPVQAAEAPFHISQQYPGGINNVEGDQYVSFGRMAGGQREASIGAPAPTKKKARWLALTGFLNLVAGLGLVTASGLTPGASPGGESEGILPVQIGLALTALGIILLITGILLCVIAYSRRRRAYRDLP